MIPLVIDIDDDRISDSELMDEENHARIQDKGPLPGMIEIINSTHTTLPKMPLTQLGEGKSSKCVSTTGNRVLTQHGAPGSETKKTVMPRCADLHMIGAG